MTITLGEPQSLDALKLIQAEMRRLAAEKPHYVYDRPLDDEGYPLGCMYVEVDADSNLIGSCIVGKALVNLGVDPYALSDHEHTSALSVLGYADARGYERPAVLDWICSVQYGQDNDTSWRDAVESADDIYPDGK